VLRMSSDLEKVVAGGNEDGEVVWFALDFAKQVANTNRCAVRHQAAVSCVKYFDNVPLMCTADTESTVIFWTLQPLRSFEFFCKLEIDFLKKKGSGTSQQGSPSSTTSHQDAGAGVLGISSLAVSSEDEKYLIVGSEHGHLVCINIEHIVERAKSQRDEIMMRKEKGEAADVISGRIFESMEKPDDSAEFVYSPENEWLVDRAHRGSVDQIIYCPHAPPIVLTLGFDVRVCIWHPYTGEALGTLEQGLPEGLTYQRRTPWRFPIDAHAQVQRDLKDLAAAVVSEAGSEEDEDGKKSSLKEESEDGKATAADTAKRKSDAGSATGGGSRAGSEKGSQKQLPMRSKSTPVLVSGTAKQSPHKLNGVEYPDYSKTKGRLLKAKSQFGHDWFAGPLATPISSCSQLPVLSSGLRRAPNQKAQSAVVTAARKLSSALNSLEGSKVNQFW